jgi:hypothetical protein
MMSLFLDKGAQLRRLSPKQMDRIRAEFILYLVHATTFLQCMSRCTQVLEPDQADLRSVIKEKLTDMIEDHYCNTVIKIAILRLAQGDPGGFVRANCNPDFTLKVIAANKKAFKRRLDEVQFGQLRSQSIARIEQEYLEKVRPHAKHYVMSKARFLMSSEHGLKAEDMINDLLLLALRSFRWYYPFRKGLHMLNTMRMTISNRGKGLVRYNVADGRRRLIMLESGEMYNRESSGEFDLALNSPNGSSDPTKARNAFIDTMRLYEKPEYAPVANFVVDLTKQAAFVDWCSHRYGKLFHNMESLSKYIAENKINYAKLLSCFLEHPHQYVNEALSQLRLAI